MRRLAKHRAVGLAAVAVLAALLPPAIGPSAFAATGEPSPPASGTPGVTLLPPLPVRLGAGQSCTAASEKKAVGASWAQAALGLPKAHQLSRGTGVTVAVIDTGVGSAIPALSGRVTAVGGADKDCVGHGSFVAGLIAAARTTGNDIVGIAPEVEILALRGTNDRGVPSVQQLADGIRLAADRGAKVIYVGQTLRTGQAALTAAVVHAMKRDALVVAPAAPDAVPREELGPDGEMPLGPYWPAAVPGVLSVVDFGPSGARQENAPPAYLPDVAAPGSAMVSVGPRGSGHYIGSGASLAAATTAGAAALIRAYYPRMSAEDVSRQLLRAAYPSDIPRLDPYGALSVILPASGQTALPATPPPAQAPPAADPTPLGRSLAIAGAGLAVVLLVAAAGVLIPRGRARNWLPPGREGG
ncbi:S8 family serine peptidase [Streptomyces sp. NPDC060022]|uniref:S8 family serine peptidase n=1 Tax=Streptomyces sp. NPDC060022 TaxID=3347039 RepID=UPI00369BD90C